MLHPPEAAGPIATLYLPGGNLAIVGLSRLFFGPLPAQMILDLHPFALSAWVGLLATSLNLIPLGQLDGGHILYAAIGKYQSRLVWPLWIVLCSFAFLWLGWLVWCLLLVAMGLRHPPVVDEEAPLDPRRRRLGLVALLILGLSFTPEPLRYLAVGSATTGQLAQGGRGLVDLEIERNRTRIGQGDVHESTETATRDLEAGFSQ
jgi:membrane-associated protease RseP (regulator of RpoE activity)